MCEGAIERREQWNVRAFEAVLTRRYDMWPVASDTILLGKMETVASLHGSDFEKTERGPCNVATMSKNGRFPMVRGVPLTMG